MAIVRRKRHDFPVILERGKTAGYPFCIRLSDTYGLRYGTAFKPDCIRTLRISVVPFAEKGCCVCRENEMQYCSNEMQYCSNKIRILSGRKPHFVSVGCNALKSRLLRKHGNGLSFLGPAMRFRLDFPVKSDKKDKFADKSRTALQGGTKTIL